MKAEMKLILDKKLIFRIRFGAFALRFVPFLRFAGLNGSVARGEANDQSDIDFLIITKRGRVYTARFFATLLIQMIGLRRHGKAVAGRICLNCYLSESSLNIKPDSLQSVKKVATSNIFLISLIESDKFYKKFMQENLWMKELVKKIPEKKSLAMSDYCQNLSERINRSKPSRPFGLFEPILSGAIGNFVENKLMAYQVSRIKRGKKVGDETLSTKDQIKLHPKKAKGGP
ncbi:MAG: hypothetical protein BWY43_00773 [candidate division WS2 bacterium ADurb.Bin280]|uniref:Polymerase nucleotidyl transferase domain-containing protein n=1 Tax=candidate division WS2 bacterium ADurb.Bin280 TaxID=1852829 RepID=A0A1V5SBK6_9BACT|nr:MAG: hypothetical protein BWY43_00773 [candidate division WS2 bacterium ADurb.Bin280]